MSARHAQSRRYGSAILTMITRNSAPDSRHRANTTNDHKTLHNNQHDIHTRTAAARLRLGGGSAAARRRLGGGSARRGWGWRPEASAVRKSNPDAVQFGPATAIASQCRRRRGIGGGSPPPLTQGKDDRQYTCSSRRIQQLSTDTHRSHPEKAAPLGSQPVQHGTITTLTEHQNKQHRNGTS